MNNVQASRRLFLKGLAGTAALAAIGLPFELLRVQTDRERFESQMRPGGFITNQEFVITDGKPLVVDKACTVSCCKFIWRGTQVQGPCLVLSGGGPITLFGISVYNETEPHPNSVGIYFARGEYHVPQGRSMFT